MTEVGRLSFALDNRQFRSALREMERDLERFQQKASAAGGAFGARGGRGVPANGRFGSPGVGVTGGGGGLGAGAAGGMMSRMGMGTMARFAGIASAGLALKGVISNAADLEYTLAQVQAVTSATSDQMEILEATARAAGASTKWSATESAEGLLELARAGQDVNAQIASLNPTLDLATAGLMSVADSADLVTNVASQFGLPATEIQRIGDALVATANRSNTDVPQMADALRTVGVVAAQAGISLEETNAALGVLAQSAQKGSFAATKLRQVISQLIAVSDDAKGMQVLEEMGLTAADVNVEALGLQRVIDNLAGARGGLSLDRANKLVDPRNSSALLALTEDPDLLRQMTREVENDVGVSGRVAQSMQNTLTGQSKALSSAFEELGHSINTAIGLTDALSKGVTGLTDGVRWLAAEIKKGSDSEDSQSPDEVMKGRNGQAKLLREAFGLTVKDPEVQRGLIEMYREAAKAGVEGAAARLQELSEQYPDAARGQGSLSMFQTNPYAANLLTMSDEDLRAMGVGVGRTPSQIPPIPAAVASSAAAGPFGPGLSPRWASPAPGTENDAVMGPSIGEADFFGSADDAARHAAVVQSLTQEAEALRLSAYQREEYNAVKAAGLDLSGEESEAIRTQVRELQQLERMDALSEGVGLGIAQIGTSFLTAADNAEESVQRILQAMSQLAITKSIVEPAADALSSFAGAFFKSGSSGRDVPGQN